MTIRDAAFDQWWDKEVQDMKRGERRYFADRIFPGDLKVAWNAGRQALLAEPATGKGITCHWQRGDDPEITATACGREHLSNVAQDGSFVYCPYCGGKLDSLPPGQ